MVGCCHVQLDMQSPNMLDLLPLPAPTIQWDYDGYGISYEYSKHM